MKLPHILFWRIARWLVVRGYGAGCDTYDLDDFPDMKHDNSARCASCRAQDMVKWIDEHIDLLQYD